MKTLIINTEAELLAAKDDDGHIVFDGNIEIRVQVFFSHGINTISARDISASGYISARDISASGYISARDISASGNISARDISASGYISARDISASGYIKLSCILGIKLTGKLTCKAVVPASCASWDREFWAVRFGIDTSNGCWDEFVERLAVVAPKLLKKKHWLPVERLMLESSMGKYKGDV